MSIANLVFHDEFSDIEELIEHVTKNNPELSAQEASYVHAAQAQEGEVWSPQLPAYEAWAAKTAEAAAQKPGAENDFGPESDLLSVGSLGMGLTDEEREVFLAQARLDAEAEAEAEGDGAAALLPGARGRSASACERAELNGAISVRREEGGYALVAVDLRRFSAALGHSEGLVVSLPSHVGGVPVVRITAESFARRYVQGVGVRLLVIPDTVEQVAAGTFSALSAGRIHVGRGVRFLGDQPCDLAGVSPHLARREYSVDARNRFLSAAGGALFADEGTRLLFLAPPYGRLVVLPAGVERVGAAAVALGCEPPSAVVCPPTLSRVDVKTWDNAVWQCPYEAPVRRMLEKREVRIAGPHAVEQDGCWFDFDENGAVLVAGPPPPASVSRRFAEQAAVRAALAQGKSSMVPEKAASEALAAIQPVDASQALIVGERAVRTAMENGAQAVTSGVGVSGAQPVSATAPSASSQAAASNAADVLALPRQVRGLPLVRLGVRALPYAPATLIVPDTVSVVDDDNTCRGVKRLTLPEGLARIGAHCFCSRVLEGIVPIPASVCSIGEGSFEYAVCRLDGVGAVVHVSADPLISCFLADSPDGVPFDFARYDEQLRSGKNLPDKLGALIHRLAMPFRLDEQTRASLVSSLHEQGKAAQQRVAREGDVAMVAALLDAGFIDEATFDSQIELLRSCNRTDCVIYLMEERRKRGFGGSTEESGGASLRDRFAL